MSARDSRKEGGVGVALSGGGHRAALWGLGALTYLVDSEVAARVHTIASVSGGSLTNAFVGANVDVRSVSRIDFYTKIARPLAKIFATQSTFLGTRVGRRAKRGLALSAFLLLSGLASVCVSPSNRIWGAVVSFAALANAWRILRARGDIASRAFDELLYGGRRLDTLNERVHHVLCATDLTCAEHVYLAPKFVYAWRRGLGAPGALTLADAVQASASYPFGFPARVIAAKSLAFPEGREGSRELVLVDGGVYDNMADQWFRGLDVRLARHDTDTSGASLEARLASAAHCDEVIVANASPAYGLTKFPSWRIVQEIAVMFRVVLAMHDNSASLRREWLVDSFERGLKRGVLVHIATSPWASAHRALTCEDPERAARARDAVAYLESLDTRGVAPEEAWRALAVSSASVETTLDAVGAEKAIGLLWHAYVLTAVHAHVFLGHPLPPRERAERVHFETLVRDEGVS